MVVLVFSPTTSSSSSSSSSRARLVPGAGGGGGGGGGGGLGQQPLPFLLLFPSVNAKRVHGQTAEGLLKAHVVKTLHVRVQRQRVVPRRRRTGREAAGARSRLTARLATARIMASLDDTPGVKADHSVSLSRQAAGLRS